MTGFDRPRFGPGGNSKRFFDEGHRSTLEAAKWLAENGLDAYEYQGGNGIHGSIGSFRRIGELMSENGIAVSLHSPYFISLSSVEEDKRLKSVSYIEQSVDAAEALGAKTIVIHCGSCAKISREDAAALSKDTLARALDALSDKLAASGVRLGIETMGKINQLGTLDEVIDICSSDRRLRPVVDFGHLNAREGGVFFTPDDFARVFDRIGNALGDCEAKNLHCHFSKIEFTSGGEKRHLTFEDEEFGPRFEPFVETMAKYGLTPTVICESDGTMADDALKMKRYFETL